MTLTAPPVTDPSLFIPELKSKKMESALAELVAAAHRAGAVRQPHWLEDLLRGRERAGTTALGKGVAVPNARSVTILRPQLLVARSARGIEWNAEDGQPVFLVFLVLSPGERSEEIHHASIARAVAVARIQRNRQRFLTAASPVDVAALMREAVG